MAQSLAKIRNLQALRAFAALPVMFFHTGYLIPHLQRIGVFGVHLFFMLSGYIMASICETDTRAFLRRRLVRILPAYWALTFALYAVAWRFPQLMGATRAVPAELLKSLFFVPFVKSNGLYQPILFIGWTVNYEMLFYVLLAVGVWLAGRRAPAVAAALILGVMAVCSVFAGANPIARFYSDPVLLEFLAGLGSYYVVKAARGSVTPAIKKALFAGALASLVLLPTIEALNWFPHASLVLRYGPLSFVLIVSACLLALRGSDIKPGLLVLIGDASYVMYLLHPYIEEAFDRILGRHIHLFTITTLSGCVISMAVVVPVSIWVYLKVEKPMLRWLNHRVCGPFTKPAEQAPMLGGGEAAYQAGVAGR